MTPEEYIERNSFKSWGENICVFAIDARVAVNMARKDLIEKLANMPLDKILGYLEDELLKIKSNEGV